MDPFVITLLVLVVATLLLLSDRVRPDLVALMVTLTLGLTGVLTVQEAFSGFSRSAVIILVAVFVLAEGLRRTGVTELAGQALFSVSGSNESVLAIVVMLLGASLSFFMNNIAAASVLLPAVAGVAHRSKISLSRLLMPLAFGTILGGMATLLTTNNIVVNGLLRDQSIQGFGLLSFLPLGLPLIIVGILYMALWGLRLLPRKTPAQRLIEQKPTDEELLHIYRLTERVIRLRVKSGSTLVGVPLSDSHLRDHYNLNVIAIEHKGKRVFPLDPLLKFDAGDVILVLGRTEDYPAAELGSQFEMLTSDDWRQTYLASHDVELIEAVLTPRSELIDHTLRDAQFREKYAVNVIAIWRGDKPIRTGLSDIIIRFGDALLMEGSTHSIEFLKAETGLVVLTTTREPKPRLTQKSWLAITVMLITLVLAVIFPDQIGEIMLAGALMMVILGILTMDQGYQAIDWKSVILIAGMLPLGVAISKTGVASSLSDLLINTFSQQSPFVLLAILMLITTIFSQVMNGAAVVAIMAPIAITMAQTMSLDPRSMAMGIAMAASLTFITPLGHPVNILVMSQAGYRFRDFLRVGLPLTLILLLTLFVLLPQIWPLSP
jgi:di/tricarboxylate transporter